ncbi:hypothetical protein DUNSADRAFT_1719 [Dunaliella salina]|uniref:Uncharacterized protein n=1 Tax=Dunaliella salina TaxID=3046 RepID=A0ABQ7FX45_DUNSA|nr:hypothetical protein DUNSADRAFT_1719 [Dunaliella salina]|eukprot:KAF5826929.1 hypothetical protein DUNSADRAFT_1719 [Dunaliella salina]
MWSGYGDPEARPVISFVMVWLGGSASRVGEFLGVARGPDCDLWHASSEGNVEDVVKLIRVARADVNSAKGDPNQDGSTSLHAASQNGQEKVVKLLLDNGAYADITDHSAMQAVGVLAMEHPSVPFPFRPVSLQRSCGLSRASTDAQEPRTR